MKITLFLLIRSLLFLWLAVQVGLIVYDNFCLQKWNIDYDSAKLYVHALEICKNRGFLIEGWKYITTAEFDCSLLFAVPFYLLLNDIYTAFALSNMIFVSLWIWTVFRLFRGAGYGVEYALLALDIILIPYGLGMLEYFNMLFFNGGQYVVKALCPLMLIALLFDRGQEKGKSRACRVIAFVYAALYAFFLCLTTVSSGIYVAVCGIVPVLGAAVYHELTSTNRLSRRTAVCGLLSAVMIVCGFALNRFFQIDAQGSDMLLNAGLDGVRKNTSGCFWGIFGLFGAIAKQGVRLMSYEGIVVAGRIFLVLLLLFCAAQKTAQALRGRLPLFEKMLLACFWWNTLILLICHTSDSEGMCHYRYHLIGIIPLICLAAVWAVEQIGRRQRILKYAMSAAGLIVLFSVAFTANRRVVLWRWEYTDLAMLCEYVNNEDIAMVYLYGHEDFAEDCRLLDYQNDDTVYLPVDDSGRTFVTDYYEVFDGRDITFDNAVLVIDEATEDIVELFGHTYQRVAQLGYLGVYR